eukprot:53085-Prorocentrum_lima.AAC.1
MRSRSCGCSEHRWTLQYPGWVWSFCYRRSPLSGVMHVLCPSSRLRGFSPHEDCPASLSID